MVTKNLETSQASGLISVLTEPTPQALWLLRGELLELGMKNDDPTMVVIDHFYQFLNRLVSSSTAREYSHFASILDMAAIAAVAIQNLSESNRGDDWWQRLIIGAMSESLMVLAARQYVKAWEEEMKASYDDAAWNLSDAYWRVSLEYRPSLPPDLRRKMVDDLVAPINDDSIDGIVKAALIVRLFQLQLLLRLLHTTRN